MNQFDYKPEESTELNRKAKLVRDKDIDLMREAKKEFIYHMAKEEEYSRYLNIKLKEEVEEYLETKKPEELIDVLEILHALCEEHTITIEELDKLRMEKKEARGGFKRGVILDTWPENS